jgi:histidine ammonia-lyase
MIVIDGENLDIEKVVRVARYGEKVRLSEKAIERIEQSRKVVEDIVNSDRIAYGIKTGFGELQNVIISKEDVKKLQRNLVLSHSSGVGEPFSTEIVRAAMLIRANALSKGYSGVRYTVVKTLVDMLNKGVHPIVPEKGSVGASGDLAPLAHIALVMIGEGYAEYNGKIMEGKKAMEMANIETLELEAKEGLALLNGTTMMNAIASLLVHDAINILKHAHISAALSMEALRASDRPLDERIHRLRPHKGQSFSAKNLRLLLKDIEIMEKNRYRQVQDAYTLRCTPQILGAVIDTVNYVKDVVEREMNSVTDNPLIFPDGDSISGGNFHGEPIAFAMDFLKIALTDMGNLSERRTFRMLDTKLSGLPPFLAKNSGLNSGYMIAQYVSAALCTENKVLSHPSSVDTIPTSASQEDHVSMGMTATLHAMKVLENVKNIIAIEMLCASQALEYVDGSSGNGTGIARGIIRNYVEELEADRPPYEDIEKIRKIVDTEEIVKDIENKIGKIEV